MEGNGGRFRWEASITPSFIMGLGQLIALIVGGTLVYSNFTNTLANTADATKKLDSATEKLSATQEKLSSVQQTQAERLIRVETNVGTLSETINRIDNKIDNLRK